MKKALTLLLLLCCAAAAQDKQKVAVYMSGEEPKGAQGVHKVLGGELAKAISRSDKYSAIDRTEAIISSLSKEHQFQRGGAVSDAQIKELGRQFGVQYLCIAEISYLQDGSYYIDVRLVDVVTAEILTAVTATSDLNGSNEMVGAAQAVARELAGVELSGIVIAANHVASKVARGLTDDASGSAGSAAEQQSKTGSTPSSIKPVKPEPPQPASDAAPPPKKLKKSFYIAVGLDAVGVGLLAYGISQDGYVKKYANNRATREHAEIAENNRNICYIAAAAFLLSGVSIHIFF